MLLVREDGWHFLLPGASGRGCDFGGQSYCGVSAARNACRLMGRKLMTLGWLKAAELVGNLGLVEVNRVGAEWCGALILVPFSCLWRHSGCSACMPAKSRLPAVEAERLEIREVNRDSRFV